MRGTGTRLAARATANIFEGTVEKKVVVNTDGVDEQVRDRVLPRPIIVSENVVARADLRPQLRRNHLPTRRMLPPCFLEENTLQVQCI